MRIALYVHCFYPTHYHGTESYTLAVAKGLQAMGHDPVVVTATFAGEPPRPELIERYVWDGVPVVMIDKNRVAPATLRHTFDHPAMREIHERLLDDLAPDVVHVCHLLNHTTALLDAVSQRKIPVMATFTDFFGVCFTNRLEAANGRLCSGPSADRANCIACVIRSGADERASWLASAVNFPFVREMTAKSLALLARYAGDRVIIDGFQPNDLVQRPSVISDAMHQYQFAVSPTQFLKDAYRSNAFSVPIIVSHFGIDIDRAPKPPRPNGSPLRLGFIAQLAPHKGLHLVVDALREIESSSVVLRIWGDVRQDPNYIAKIKRRSGGQQLRFEGVIDPQDLARALSEIDFLVLPSTWYENSPLILLQALATHTPVIVSDVPGLVEFVQEGTNGFSFPRNDVPALAKILRHILDRPGIPETMSQATSYERTSRDMVADLCALYEQMVQPLGRAGGPNDPIPAS